MHKKYDSIWIEFKAGLNKNDRTTLLNLAYNPNRNNKTDFLEDLAKSIDHAQSFNSNLILLGDYNLNYLNEDDKQSLDTILIPYNLDVTNKLTPTQSKALIDYIITDLGIKDLTNNSIVFIPPIKTDHQATAFITELKLNNNVRPTKRKIYDKSNYSNYKFKQKLSAINWRSFYSNNNPAIMLDIFTSNIADTIKECAPQKTIFIRNDKPKVNYEDDKFISQLFNSKKSEREKWSLINDRRNSKKSSNLIPLLRNSFGDFISNNLQMVNLLNYKFSTLGCFNEKNSKIRQNPPTSTCKNRNINKFSFRFITSAECKKEIHNLNCQKAPGPSKIPAWALKDGCNEIYTHLTFLYNEFLKNKTYPCKLKKAIATPIYKKEDPELPENYRSISITGALSKVFEKLLHNQINDYLISQKFLSNTQFGFRKSYSTIDAILYCTEAFRKAINNNKTVAFSLLDLSKAFDSIDHTYLKQKLKVLNFSEEAIEMINSLITNRSQKTIVNNTESDWIALEQSVPQGTVLGPLIFNLYIKDLNKQIDKTCKIVQYADDTLLFCENNDPQKAIKALEANCSLLSNYFLEHSLQLNAKKKQNSSFSAKNIQGKRMKSKL